MTDEARVIADALITAEQERTPILPFTRNNPFLSVETAYRAQGLLVAHHLAAGQRIVGAKLGLTSRVKQRALGIDEPVYGRLTSGMLRSCADPLSLADLIHPRVEPEIAFLIGRPIEAPTTVAGVLAATEAVLPALEVVDTRYSAAFRLQDSVADNAGAARVIIGAAGRPPEALVDLSVLGCVFRARGELATAAGGAAMGHPARALVWLADSLAARGERIEAGWVVLSGGLTASVALAPSSVVTAEFDGLGVIAVQCT